MINGKDIKRRKLEEKHLLECLLALLDDASDKFGVDVTHDQVYLLNRVDMEGFAFVSKTLPKFYKHILRCIDDQLFTPYPGFRKESGGRGLLPAFLQGWTSRIFAYDGTVRHVNSGNSVGGEALQFLSTFCQGFGSKYEFDLSPDMYDKHVREAIDLEDNIFDEDKLAQACLDENTPYWEPVVSDRIVNSDLVRQNGPTYHAVRRDIVIYKKFTDGGYKWSRIDKEINRLLSNLFRGFDPLDIRPCHGPGSVYERSVRLPHEKYAFPIASDAFSTLYPFNTYFRPSPETRLEPLPSNFSYHRDLPVERFAREIGGISRHRVVPKNAEKGRDIDLEGTALMYMQKGLQKALYSYLQSHPMLSTTLPNGRRVSIIGFDDQSVNQYWALEASMTREKATLDLKSASSFVSCAHVDRYMPKHMRECLNALRSTYVEYAFKRKGRAGRRSYEHPRMIVKSKTFAPMGSAICFPVEAVIFWATATAALHYFGCNEPVYVYGDDLIVPTRYAEFVILTLQRFGFKVNDQKSFIKGHFRESCGVDAYKGMNVSATVRVKKQIPLIGDTVKPKKKDTLGIDSQGAAGLVAWLKYSNLLYAENYVSCAEYIRRVLKSNFPRIWKYIPRVCDPSDRDSHLSILDYTAQRTRRLTIPTPEPRFRPKRKAPVGPQQCPIFEYISWAERRPPWYHNHVIKKAVYLKTPSYKPKDFDESRRYLRWVAERGEDTSRFTTRNSVLLKIGPCYSS